MKVLFAVNNEKISENIIKKYQKEYREILSFKNVYYFDAILKEIQRDKTYDRIVISEDLEPFANSNYDQIDNFIFNKLDNISDEAQDIDGNDTSIILICSDRRTPGTSFLVKIFGIGIYNALLGQERSLEQVCKLINKPRVKREAKNYYKIDSNDVDYNNEKDQEVSEMELQNILTHFKKLGKNTDKYAASFDNIAEQYNDEQLKIIVNCLPINVKAVLEEDSIRYQQLMSASNGAITRVNRDSLKTSDAMKNTGISIDIFDNKNAEPKISGPIVIPASVRTSNNKTPQPVRPQGNTLEVPETSGNTVVRKVIKKDTPQVAAQPAPTPHKNVVSDDGEYEIIKKKVRLEDGTVVIKKFKKKKNNNDDDEQSSIPPVIENKKEIEKKQKELEEDDSLDLSFDEDEITNSVDDMVDEFAALEQENSSSNVQEENVEETSQEEESSKPNLDELDDDENANFELPKETSDELPGLDDLDDLPGLNDDLDDDDDLLNLGDDLPAIEADDDDGLSLPSLDDDDDDINPLPELDDDTDTDTVSNDDTLDDEMELPDFDDDTELEEISDDDSEIVGEDEEIELSDDEELEEIPDNDDEVEELTEEVDLPGLDELDDLDDDVGEIPGVDDDDDMQQDEVIDNGYTQPKSAPNNSIDSIKPKYDYSMSNLNSLLTKDKKIVTFVGTSKNGTSFLVNNLAVYLSSIRTDVAILDMTKNKNSYYIYTKNEESLRNIAYNSISKLQNGFCEGIKVNDKLHVFTALPNDGKDYSDAESILSTLVQNYSIILIDCDFDTPPAYFASCQEMYLVQSYDILTIQPLTAFLRNLKTLKVLEPEKIRVVINKELPVKALNPKNVIAGMSMYNDPSMSFQTDLFNKDIINHCTIPFDEKAYVKYLDDVAECSINVNSYGKAFLSKLQVLANMVDPQVGGSSSRSNVNQSKKVFSSSMDNTLNQMKKKI